MLRFKYQAFADTSSENVFKAKKQANPITLVVLGYLMIIALGAVLLRLPLSTREPIDFLQALFTATSAVCVTGLSVIDISSTFSGITSIADTSYFLDISTERERPTYPVPTTVTFITRDRLRSI